MSTYAIGDLQGCFHSFINLLDTFGFNKSHDRLWLVGDLINRGPYSLEVLRWLRENANCVTTVLGNHDLHALAVHEGLAPLHRNDTLDALLEAPDRDGLFDWLRLQCLAYAENGYLIVHAGLLPQWNAATARILAQEVETALRGPDYRDFLTHMYGNLPDRWEDNLSGMGRLRIITNAMTRMRVCTPDGQMEFRFKGEPKDIPIGFLPWFDVKNRNSKKDTLIFGHWSAMGLVRRKKLIGLDTGCLWGGKLTAVRLEDQKLFQVPRAPEDAPTRK